MKQIIIVLSILYSFKCYPQNLTEREFLSQLPRTTDDFQKYQCDYDLENLMDHYPVSPFNIYSSLSSFDGTGLFPFEHNCDVREIECLLYKKRNGEEILTYAVKEKFSSDGILIDFQGKTNFRQNYAFGYKRWSAIDGVPLSIIPSAPNPYTTDIAPTRNKKGLIEKVGNDWIYKYDTYDRVIEIRNTSGKYVYQYQYLNTTKNIKHVNIIISNRIRGEVSYFHYNGKIAKLVGNLLNENGFAEKEFMKQYTYDSRSFISSIFYLYKDSDGTRKSYKYNFDNEYDNKGRIIISKVNETKSYHNGPYGGTSNPNYFTRTYTYDKKGNWIKIDDSEGNYLIRNIVYKQSPSKGVLDKNYVYDEDDVDVRATMGSYFQKLVSQKKFMPFPEMKDYEKRPANINVNIDFIVEKDGSISNFEAGRETRFTEEAQKAITNLIWIPALRGGQPVRSSLSLAWRFALIDGKYHFYILKDVVYSTDEKESYDKSVDIYKAKRLSKLVHSGDLKAKKDLAKLYSSHNKQIRNINKALEIYTELALNDDSDAQNEICTYKDIVFQSSELVKKLAGLYLPYSSHKNQLWNAIRCEAAAMSGNETAILEIANRYETGSGVSKDENTALKWRYKAAKSNPDLMFELGKQYLNPLNVYFDNEKGIQCVIEAVKMGNIDARNSLIEWYKTGTYVAKDKKKAKRLKKDPSYYGD